MLEKVLFACDELSGFISACALVKPSKKVAEVEAKSVKKKMKEKGLARSVSRDDIGEGAAGLGTELDAHVEFCIRAMQEAAETIGL